LIPAFCASISISVISHHSFLQTPANFRVFSVSLRDSDFRYRDFALPVEVLDEAQDGRIIDPYPFSDVFDSEHIFLF
jgi:hypothetical protein